MAIYSGTMKYGDAVPLGFVGAVFAVLALALGIAGLLTIRRYPEEYTGSRLAQTGLIGGLILFTFGSAISVFTYATEVPKDCIRTGFWELQPDPDHPDMIIPPRSLELAGKKIFIKGYMHPGVASRGKVNHFILVNDLGTCCFGGQPKPTHMIEISIPNGVDRVAYSTGRLKLAGTFWLTPPTPSLGLQGVMYHLDVDQVR